MPEQPGVGTVAHGETRLEGRGCHRFELSFGPDAHNDVVRFTWDLTAGNGPVARGTDFATVAEDGRLRSVTGFLEAV